MESGEKPFTVGKFESNPSVMWYAEADRLVSWRTYTAAALTGTTVNVAEGDMPALCHIASEIADQMVRGGAKRTKSGAGKLRHGRRVRAQIA